MAMNTGGDRPEWGPGSHADKGDERLSCGRMLSEVWEAGESGDGDPHLRQCPHCLRAVDQLGLLEEAVRQSHSGDEPAWDTEGLTERIMDVVRLELRPGRSLPLGEQEEDLWATEAMASKVLRRAAESVAGVRAGSCRILPLNDDSAAARGPLRVRLEVVVPLAGNLHSLAEEIRQRVQAAADNAVGLPVAAVDIRIVDVVDDAGSAQSR